MDCILPEGETISTDEKNRRMTAVIEKGGETNECLQFRLVGAVTHGSDNSEPLKRL